MPSLAQVSAHPHRQQTEWPASQSTSGAAGGADVATKQAALNGRAYGQFKSVAFLCFIMWMSGSQIHLFSIMTTVSGIYQPLMAIFNSEKSAGAAAGALRCFTHRPRAVLTRRSARSVPGRAVGGRQAEHPAPAAPLLPHTGLATTALLGHAAGRPEPLSLS